MKLTKRDKRTNLEKEIDTVLELMSTVDSRREDYDVMVNHLKTLYEAKATEKSKHISPDTIAIIAGNLLGIALILGYEQTNVVTTKALGCILRSRV